VFLGGSIVNHGGQNPLEPARLGCKILHGPNIQNFTEVYRLLNKENLSFKFYNTNQLAKSVNQSLNQNINFSKKISRIYRRFAKKHRWKMVSPGTKQNTHREIMKIISKKIGS